MSQEGNHPAPVLPALWDLVGSRGCHRCLVGTEPDTSSYPHIPTGSHKLVYAVHTSYMQACGSLSPCNLDPAPPFLSIAVPCCITSCPSLAFPFEGLVLWCYLLLLSSSLSLPGHSLWWGRAPLPTGLCCPLLAAAPPAVCPRPGTTA